ncbi:MAG TPA: hypothetical protein VFN21_09195 [Acidimicrobiales bacterium]|nr:hypothetical protein [Acidimicrobiales bacterium]
MPTSPNTVTEAVNLLAAEGYTADLGLYEGAPHAEHDANRYTVERVFRFEGDSDPADEAIVIGVFCPECDARGTVVSAYGHEADPALIARLVRRPTV